MMIWGFKGLAVIMVVAVAGALVVGTTNTVLTSAPTMTSYTQPGECLADVYQTVSPVVWCEDESDIRLPMLGGDKINTDYTATLAQPTPVPLAPVIEQQVTVPTEAPVPVPTLAPVLVVPCSFAKNIAASDPVLQDAMVRGVARLTDVLGCVPFTLGNGGITVQFAGDWFTDTSDPGGIDWTWVPAAKPVGWLTDHPELDGVLINPRCWARVSGDWSIVIAHELGHHLGWLDLDGHPYMACPLVEGEYYRDDLVVVCGSGAPVLMPTPSPTPTSVHANDSRYTACLVDEAGAGVTTAWALETVEAYWGVKGSEDCTDPDLSITVRVFHGQQFGGLYDYRGNIEINSGVFDVAAFGPLLSKKVLLHEWGHFAGLEHLDAPSVMYYVAGNFPTDSDRSLVTGFDRK